jgi:hypothetical protein
MMGTVAGRGPDAVELLLDAAIAFARDALQSLTVKDGDVPPVIADQPGGLEESR